MDQNILMNQSWYMQEQTWLFLHCMQQLTAQDLEYGFPTTPLTRAAMGNTNIKRRVLCCDIPDNQGRGGNCSTVVSTARLDV